MVIGSKLYRCKQCADSLAWARDNIVEAPDGAVFLADELTQARGRLGNVWSTYPGQLTVTILLKPFQFSVLHKDELQIRLNQLSMAMSLGICTPLIEYGVKLKWPNDFVVNGKKVGGMLMQSVWLEGNLKGCILGFSLNINNVFTSEDPLFAKATSLIKECGMTVHMRDLYKAILVSLDGYYTLWKQGDWAVLYQQWRSYQAHIGMLIKVHRQDGTELEGIMQQVLPSGDMLMLVKSKLEVVPFHSVGSWEVR